MPGILTDKKGEYIWRMNIDPLETRNCVVRATHAGYTSSEVEVSGVDTTHTTLDLAAYHDSPFRGRPLHHQLFGNRHTPDTQSRIGKRQ